MTEPTMRERIASAILKAIKNHDPTQTSGGRSPFIGVDDDLSDVLVEGYVDLFAAADAVLAKMERPTVAMLVAARDWSLARLGKPVGNDAAIGCWQAMIAAAREAK